MASSHSLKKKLVFSLTIAGISVCLAMALGEIYVRARYDFVTPDLLRRRSLQYTGSIFSRNVFPPEEQIVYGNDDSRVKWFINERGFGQRIVQLEMAVSLPSRGRQAVPEADKRSPNPFAAPRLVSIGTCS